MPNSVTMRGTRVVARSMSCPAPVLASPKTTISAAWPPSSGGKSYRVLPVETEPSTTIGRRSSGARRRRTKQLEGRPNLCGLAAFSGPSGRAGSSPERGHDVRRVQRKLRRDVSRRGMTLTLTGAPSDNTMAGGVDILPVDGIRAPLLADIAAIEREALGYPRAGPCEKSRRRGQSRAGWRACQPAEACQGSSS